jgi:hypothetical protein
MEKSSQITAKNIFELFVFVFAVCLEHETSLPLDWKRAAACGGHAVLRQ